MKRLLSFSLAALMISTLGAQQPPPMPPTPIITVGELTISGDIKTVLVVNKFPITIKAPQDGGALHWWQFPDGVMGVDNGESLEVTGAPAGEVNVTVRYAVPVVDWEKKTFKLVNKTLSTIFVNGSVPVPPPPPPHPPGPTPTANPFGNVPGLRVLMTYETATKASLPPSQFAVLFGRQMRDYLEANCAPRSQDSLKEYRIYDKDIPLVGESQVWQDVTRKRPADAVLWMAVGNGASGWSGPLPADFDAAKKMIDQFTK